MVVFGAFMFNGGHKTVIPVIHLSSDLAKDFLNQRIKQLGEIFKYCKKFKNAILMGDFNFGDGEEPDKVEWGDFKDIWKMLKPQDVGYTFDPITNILAKLNSVSGKRRRLDRILLKSEKFKPKNIKMFGTDKTEIIVKGKKLESHCSDHFGLICEIEVN